MKEIEKREDVYKLVSSFYAKIRVDEILGPIFNKMLTTDEIWAEHLEKLTDFWETNLFHIVKFKGNPMEAHQRADKANHYSMSQDHFHHWLMMWNGTVNSLFEGEKAELAKEKARRMATHLFMNVHKHKPTEL